MQSTLKVAQESSYLGDDTWEWAVWLEGTEDDLNNIDRVVYTLHRSFPNPVRSVTNREDNFRLSATGWGTFRMYVEVIYRDGTRFPIEHDLQLLYPEESPSRATATSASLTLIERMTTTTPKRLLAIDSGGVRSVISLEVLARIEELLRTYLKRPNLVLADYFDYVAGTSTGAILAACVAQGMQMSHIREVFLRMAPEMFDKASLLNRYYRHKFESAKTASMLKAVFGENTMLGSDKLKTLLMIVLRNATSDTAWIVSNNPFAKYNDASRPWSELSLPLWQVLKASSAAPTYFPPEVLRIGGTDAVFMDGGMTGFGNPAFQLFLRATAEPYRVRWPVGENKLLLVSVGTGWARDANVDLRPDEMNVLYMASSIPSALLGAFMEEQDLLCRMFGRCLAGERLDREVGDMIGVSGPVQPKLFTYARYDAELTQDSLVAIGLNDIEPKNVQQQDSVEYLSDLERIGRAIAERKVKLEHYAGFGL
jgi:predicted acylesterase/phospholipase RssA